MTRGSLGDAPGALPDLDAAVTSVAQLAALGDTAFTQAVGDAGAKIDAAVKGAYGSLQPDAAAKAKDVQDATRWAWQRNRDLAAAVAANDRAAVTRARLDIQNALATALGTAHLAVSAHAPSSAPSAASSTLQVAAKAAVLALSADPNYCTSIIHPGTPVNAAVHRFKLAWNASQSPKLPVGTGTYEVATTVALAQVFGSAPSACGPGQRPVPAPKPPPLLPPQKQEELTAPEESGWSLGKVAAVAALGAAVIGTGAYLVTRPKKPPRSTVSRREGYAP